MKPIGSVGVAAGTASPDWMALAPGIALVAVALLFLFARALVSPDFRSGMLLGLRGLMSKELRSRSRGWRPMWLLTGYLVALTLAVAGFLALARQAGGVISPTVGTQLFSALAVGSVLLLAFITPALTVGSVSGERERRTLDLLLVTRASPLGLATGKLLGALFYVVFLLFASLPAYAVVYLFGGVPPLYLVMVVAVAAAVAVAHASLGLLLSAVLKRTLVASVLVYLGVLALVLGLPFVSAVLALTRMGLMGEAMPMAAPAAYLYASPMLSLASVLPTGLSGGGVPLVGDLMRVLVSGGSYGLSAPQTTASIAQTVYVVASNPATGEMETAVGWAPWVHYFLFSAGTALLCLFVSALALAPVKPWRRVAK